MNSVRRTLCLYNAEPSVWPPIDLFETDDEVVCEIDLPGIEPDDVALTFYGDVLVIEGIRRDQCDGADLRYICMERGVRKFRRMIKFPHPVRAGEGEARYCRGVISVRFPKLDIRPVTITVKRAAE